MKKAIAITLCILSLFTVGCEKAFPYESVETGNPEIQSFYNMPDKIIVRKYGKEVEIEKGDKNFKKVMDLIEYSQKNEVFKDYALIDYSYSSEIYKDDKSYHIGFYYNEPQSFSMPMGYTDKNGENKIAMNNIKCVWAVAKGYANANESALVLAYSQDLYVNHKTTCYTLAGPVFLAENYTEVLDKILK